MNKELDALQDLSVFDKDIMFDALVDCYGSLSRSSQEKQLKKYIENGEIARVGRNAYCLKGELKDYKYSYSNISLSIVNILNTDFYDLDYRIFELYQLNHFLNHQIAHNIIFVYVEKELTMPVFERLKKQFAGNILINPTNNDFCRYRQENMIVVKKLLTESPKGQKEVWHTDLEKMLVDIFSDSLLKTMFSESEYPSIYEKVFSTYVVDESQMFRYARRRKVEDKIKKFIREETNVELRLK